MSVSNMLPNPTIERVVIEKDVQNRGGPQVINFNPHISKADQIQYYGESEVTEGDSFLVSVRVEMGDLEWNLLNNKKLNNFKDFLSKNTNVNIIQVTSPEVARIVRESFADFYVVAHNIVKTRNANINKIKGSILSGEIIIDTLPREELKAYSSLSNDGQTRNLFVERKYSPSVNSEYLSYFTYLDVDLSEFESQGMDSTQVSSVLDNFVVLSELVVVDGSEVSKDSKVVDLTSFESIRSSYDIHMSDFEDAYRGFRNGVTPDIVNPEIELLRHISVFRDVVP